LTWLSRATYNLRLSVLRIFGGTAAVAYAIIRTGGKQFRVSPGDVVHIPSLAGKNAGDAVEFSEVLAAGDAVDGALDTGVVVKNGRGPKIIVFKFKRRKQYKRKQGHRQGYTTVKIETIA
jgi:large subunit ribosomal protein L21